VKHSESLERASTRRDRPPVNRWSDAEFKQQRDLDLTPESISTRQVFTAVVLCLTVAALLTSGKLVESAERRSFGTKRDVLLSIALPIDRVANAISFNRPADWVESQREGSDEPSKPIVTQPDAIDAPTNPVSTIPQLAEVGVAQPPADADVEPESIRSVSAESPLNLLVVGDSQAEFPGQALTNRAVKGKIPYEVEFDSRIATGLARPDYFDWPSRLLEVDGSVEAVVLFFGGNDYQDMELDGERLVRGSDDWLTEYRSRIDLVLDTLSAEGRQIFWIANPPVRDSATSQALGDMNSEVRAAASLRSWVTVIAADERFAPSGRFSAYLRDADGVETRVRSGDGVHLTAKGAGWLADMIVAEIARHWTVTGQTSS
jgi:hypothetical protein